MRQKCEKKPHRTPCNSNTSSQCHTPDYPETFQTVRKLSRLSRNFPDCPETFQTVQKLSRLSGIFPDCPETFQTIRNFSKLSGNFPDCPETFQTVRTLSRLSGNFPDCPETFQTVGKLSSWLDLRVNFVYMRKNFPDTQKLSGRQCRRADGVFLPLATCYPSDDCIWRNNFMCLTY